MTIFIRKAVTNTKDSLNEGWIFGVRLNLGSQIFNMCASIVRSYPSYASPWEASNNCKRLKALGLAAKPLSPGGYEFCWRQIDLFSSLGLPCGHPNRFPGNHILIILVLCCWRALPCGERLSPGQLPLVEKMVW